MSVVPQIRLYNPGDLRLSPEELRKAYPWSVKAYTRKEAEEGIRKAMATMGMGEKDLPDLMKRWEETYGFKEEGENEFGEVSP